MVPGPVVHLVLRSFDLDGPGAHVQYIWPLVYLSVLLAALVFLSFLWFTMGEQDETIGFRGPEVKGDRAHSLGVPLGVQSGHILTLEHHVSLDLHLRVHNARQT
uniref:Uncharacterized protein n=1 Tax=Esox lucius TaxID=8010 RepID=A0AAY5KAY6_ESOLU